MVIIVVFTILVRGMCEPRPVRTVSVSIINSRLAILLALLSFHYSLSPSVSLIRHFSYVAISFVVFIVYDLHGTPFTLCIIIPSQCNAPAFIHSS